jgi:K+-transporting ATPase ATPase A chain
MSWQGWLQIVIFAAFVTAAVKPLGGFITRNVGGGGRVQRAFAPLEHALYRLAGVDPEEEQSWVQYALALLWFNLAGTVALYALLRLQHVLPLNPQQLGPMPPDLALNTAVSFTTNTSWQSYGGESTLGYLAQMAGLVVQSFLSAASGIAVAIALVRGFARRSSTTIGNLWVDMTRLTLYVLLPICVVATTVLLWQGVPQTFGPYVTATTSEGGQQVLARGPVASDGCQAAEWRRRWLL